MKKSLALFGAFLTAGMITAPAYAAESPSYYISGNVGASWFNDVNIKDHVTQINKESVTTDAGITVLGALGVKWCDRYRVEAEYGYQRNNAKEGSDSRGSAPMKGNIAVTSVLANGYYDFKAGAVNPYLTAGIGWTSVGVNNVGVVINPNPRDESHSVLGYQFGAGVAIPVAKNVDIDARYRYFRTSTVRLDNSDGDFQFASNSVLVGLRLGF